MHEVCWDWMCIQYIIYIINVTYTLTGTIPDYCKAHPTAVFESDTNCAKYYNCSDVKSRIGGNPVECKYPDLFSTKTNQCENFTLVKCENRTEPQAPCKLS